MTPVSKIGHHPKDATLAAFAAGALDEARSVVIATHLTLCEECRLAVADFEAAGGVFLETVEPAPMSDSAMASFWLRAGKQEKAPISAVSAAANDFSPAAARPLSAYLAGGIDAIEWRPLAPGLSQHVIPAQGYRPGVLRLLKIATCIRTWFLSG